MKSNPGSPPHRWLPQAALPCLAAVCLAASSGCTSVISSAYLREAWLDAVDHASDRGPDDDDATPATRSKRGDRAAEKDPGAGDHDDLATPSRSAAADVLAPASLDEACAEADRRLARSGGLSDAARAALVATLRNSPRQDWPVVIEEFTAVLATPPGEATAAADRESGPAAEPATATDAAPAAPVPEPAAIPAAGRVARPEPIAPLPPAAQDQSSVTAPGPDPAQADPPRSAFRVQNACFASRVRGWGAVDRFETATFQPGQELIVYFELDQPGSRQSADGHTTRIDTALCLVAADGSRLHEWTFEPLEETCPSQRRDYFARYLVTVPASLPPGPCRLEMVVSDTNTGRSAQTSLPLEIAAR